MFALWEYGNLGARRDCFQNLTLHDVFKDILALHI